MRTSQNSRSRHPQIVFLGTIRRRLYHHKGHHQGLNHIRNHMRNHQ